MTDKPFIDAHVHFFNAHYVPVEGFLRQHLGLPPRIARALANLIDAIAASDDLSARPRPDWPPAPVGPVGRLGGAQLARAFTARTLFILDRGAQRRLPAGAMAARGAEAIPALEAALSLAEGRPVVLSAARRQARDGRLSAAAPAVRERRRIERGLSRFYDLVERAARPTPHEKEHDDRRDVSSPRSRFRSTLRFAANMLDSESQLIDAYLADWQGAPPERVVSFMMDMQHGYGLPGARPPLWEFREAMTRFRIITARHNADPAKPRMTTTAAVDPLRGPAWEGYFEHGLAEGFRDFKFYPPMGFRACNSDKVLTGDGRPWVTPLDEAALKRRRVQRPPENPPEREALIEALLKRVAAEGAGLVAHCTPTGHEAKPGLGLHSDPAYWAAAYRTYGLHDMRLLLAHGGGTREYDWWGWSADDRHWPDTFAARVVQLCEQYPNVYCDLSYLLKVFEPIPRQRVFTRLRLIYEAGPAGSSGPYFFGQKAMFGVDWHMQAALGNLGFYRRQFETLFEEPIMAPWREDFFRRNALRWMGQAPAPEAADASGADPQADPAAARPQG